MKKVILSALFFISLSAQAGDCVLSINRTACAGKETAAYKPYNGKNPTEEKKSVADAGACKAEAEKAAKIVRKGTLSKKVVTATFDGAAAGTASDEAACK